MNELKDVVEYLRQNPVHRVAILTGAGISAESGVPTLRRPGGLWRNYRPEDLATPEAFRRDPSLIWSWYEWRRDLIRKAQPNAAHEAIARLEHARSVVSTVITQNVDGLHIRAGSTSVIELHGNLFRVRCLADGKVRSAPDPFPTLLPRCECGALLRPDVVWFGEPLSKELLDRAIQAIEVADILLIVGTSGVVYPAAGLAGEMRRGRSIEINPEATPLSRVCDDSLRDSAVTTVPPIIDAILGARA